jgi:hypothetical protein
MEFKAMARSPGTTGALQALEMEFSCSKRGRSYNQHHHGVNVHL